MTCMMEESTLHKSADNINLGGAVYTPDGCPIQRDLGKLKKWSNRNLVKFNNKRSQSFHP